MGYEKIKRPLLTPGGLEVGGQSTATADITMSGAGLREAVQTLTGNSTGTTITNYGVTFITVGAGEGTAVNLRYGLAAPEAGAVKHIAVTNVTTKEVIIVTHTSLATFFGSTYNALSFTTGTGTNKQNQMFQLVGKNSTTWAVLSGSTAIAVQAGATV